MLEPAPGLLSDILATLEEAGERHAGPLDATGRRMAYMGGIAAAATAGAAGAILIATRGRKGRMSLAGSSPRRPAGASVTADPRSRRVARRWCRIVAGDPSPPDPAGGSAGRCTFAEFRNSPEGSSSIGRAPVSKTGGWGFESLLPCVTAASSRTSALDNKASRHGDEPRNQANAAAPRSDDRGRCARAANAAASRRRRDPRPARSGPAREFLNEVRAELRKVAWPTKSETINYSIIVFVAVVVLTAFVGALDYVFGEFVLKLYNQ